MPAKLGLITPRECEPMPAIEQQSRATTCLARNAAGRTGYHGHRMPVCRSLSDGNGTLPDGNTAPVPHRPAARRRQATSWHARGRGHARPLASAPMKRPRSPPRGLPLARKETANCMLAKRHRLQSPACAGEFAATLRFKIKRRLRVSARAPPSQLGFQFGAAARA